MPPLRMLPHDLLNGGLLPKLLQSDKFGVDQLDGPVGLGRNSRRIGQQLLCDLPFPGTHPAFDFSACAAKSPLDTAWRIEFQ